MFDRLRHRLRAVLPGGPSDLGGEVVRVPDDLPPTGLTPPLQVDRLVAEWNSDEARAEFRIVVRDADGRRCPNIAVEASVRGPSREAKAEITTDLMGAAQFRMADGTGAYTLEVLDVGAQGITWDPAAGVGTSVSLEA